MNMNELTLAEYEVWAQPVTERSRGWDSERDSSPRRHGGGEWEEIGVVEGMKWDPVSFYRNSTHKYINCPMGNPSKTKLASTGNKESRELSSPVIRGHLQWNSKLCVLLRALQSPLAFGTYTVPVCPKAKGILWVVHVSLSHRIVSPFLLCTQICILQCRGSHLLQRAVASLRKIQSSIHLWHSLQPTIVPGV